MFFFFLAFKKLSHRSGVPPLLGETLYFVSIIPGTGKRKIYGFSINKYFPKLKSSIFYQIYKKFFIFQGSIKNCSRPYCQAANGSGRLRKNFVAFQIYKMFFETIKKTTQRVPSFPLRKSP